MSFHVEVRRSFHRARVFNLTEDEVRKTVLEPWTSGANVELGDREWRAVDSELTVLEGRALDASELALGQGWNNAAKVAEDVTRRLLSDSAPVAAGRIVAVLADDPDLVREMTSFLSDLGLETVTWEIAQAGVLTKPARDSPPIAAIVMLQAPLTPQLALAVGFALGALGGRVVLALVRGAPIPPELAPLEAVRLEGEGQAPLRVLAEQLRKAGCRLDPRPGWDRPARFSSG